VLRNLIDNALRYGPTGSVVQVELVVGEHMACVRVRDEGPGFPADFRARAFDAFSRADPARDRSTGTAGLGLAIARGIVDAHDGIIQIGDPPGGCVEVHLPLAGRPATRSIA
jgi:signal transduction histidine kinase